MSYATAEALRAALEQRLNGQSRASGVAVDRLRRRVVVERVVARLVHAAPGAWVLKGGMALEVRLRDRARVTKDVDLGMRDRAGTHAELRDRLVEALSVDPFGDRFVLAAGAVTELGGDGDHDATWRSSVGAQLAGRPFGRIKLDVSPRAYELGHTEILTMPNSLAFAGIEVPAIEGVDANRHAAEKLHAMLRDFGTRENSRVRDLLDLVILLEHQLLDTETLSTAVRRVWHERDAKAPPAEFPALPESWPRRYEHVAADLDLTARSFPDAARLVADLWVALAFDEA